MECFREGENLLMSGDAISFVRRRFISIFLTDLKTSMLYTSERALALGLWIKLARAYNQFHKGAAENVRTFGLTLPQFGAIECLGHLGEMTLGDLSKKMLSSGGNITVVIDNLEKVGLVERIHSQTDRRSITVHLTEKGETLFHELFPLHAKALEDFASVLTHDEQRQLSALLKKLGLALEKKISVDSRNAADGNSRTHE